MKLIIKICNYYRKLNNKEINLPQIIKNDNYSNLTFKKTLTGEILEN